MSELVNGKFYPMLDHFVETKNKYIGGRLVECDMGIFLETIITDIKLEPNGSDSAFFSIVGEKFTCGFDVNYGGPSNHKPFGTDLIHFGGYGSHMFAIGTN